MLSLLVAAVLTGPAHANDGDSFANYDSIVSELKADAETTPVVKLEPMDWDSVALHGSLGLAGSLISVPNQRRGTSSPGFLKGFEAAIGSNTFSSQARAELAFRNFANERVAAGLDAEMREFEARMIFLPKLQDDVRLRMGFGLTQRLLNFASDGDKGDRSGTYYTLLIGAERSVAKAISVGPDLAYRDSMSRASGRKSSWDASFRLNATF